MSSPIARARRRTGQGGRQRSESQQICQNDALLTPSDNLFINYLPPFYTDSDLRALCAPYGEIHSSKIMVNLETGESKCFGFVKFATLAQAQEAITNLNGKVIHNKRLLVKYASSKEKRGRESFVVYIKQIPDTLNEQSILELFRTYGPIADVIPHMVDPVDPTVWRCFVQYSCVEDARLAVSEMNNKVIADKTRPIHVCFGDPQMLPVRAIMHCSVGSLLDDIDERMLLPSFLKNE